MIDKAAVLSVNYAGSQTHFLAGGGNRGYATNSVSPDYLVPLGAELGSVGRKPCHAGSGPGRDPRISPPLPELRRTKRVGPQGAVAVSPVPEQHRPVGTDRKFQLQLAADLDHSASVASPLRSLQLHLLEGDRRHPRASDAVPGGAAGRKLQQVLSVGSSRPRRRHLQPAECHQRHLGLPASFRRGCDRCQPHPGPGNRRRMGLSGIYKYRPGVPLQVTNSFGCNSATTGGQGTCLPDYAPGMGKANARINGKWGHGPGANASEHPSRSSI